MSVSSRLPLFPGWSAGFHKRDKSLVLHPMPVQYLLMTTWTRLTKRSIASKEEYDRVKSNDVILMPHKGFWMYEGRLPVGGNE
jgi:hypothetical protein